MNSTHVIVRYDDTDHISFHCEICGGVMDVSHVSTERVIGKNFKCTHIFLRCSKHPSPFRSSAPWRKFYWRGMDACPFPTNGQNKRTCNRVSAVDGAPFDG